MSSDRRNHSEIICNNLLQKDHSKKGFIMEDTNDNIFDSLMFPEGLHKKTTDFNFDDNLSIDNKYKINKNIIKIITHKFHELFLKLVFENRNLKNELQSIRKDQFDIINSYKKNEVSNTTYEKSEKVNNTNHNINIGNLSLQDLNNDIHIKDKKNESFEENEIISQFKEDEIELFNSIVNEFNIQINELESKDDFLRREINKKLEEMGKLNIEYDEVVKTKQTIMNEIQNISLKLNEYKAFLNSLPNDFVRKGDSVIIHADQDEEEKVNNNYSMRNKDDKVVINYFDTANLDEMRLMINNENKDYLLKRLYEENLQYKEIVAKLRYDAIKCQSEILILEKEFLIINEVKMNLSDQIHKLEKGITEILILIESLNSRYKKVVFYKNEGDLIREI